MSRSACILLLALAGCSHLHQSRGQSIPVGEYEVMRQTEGRLAFKPGPHDSLIYYYTNGKRVAWETAASHARHGDEGW